MAESETPLTGHRSVTRRLTGHSRQETTMRFTLGSSFALKSVTIAVVFLITVVFLIALVFLIAGLGPAFAEVEDFSQRRAISRKALACFTTRMRSGSRGRRGGAISRRLASAGKSSPL
jgi:hypothetical protein